jgi:TolB protein
LIAVVVVIIVLLVLAVTLIHKKAGYPASLLGICGTATAPSGSAPLPTSNLLFDANRTGNYEIYTAPLDGLSSPHQLTADKRFDSYYARSSPDRRRILFYRTPAGVPESNYMLTSLWMMDADGSQVTELISDNCYGWLFQGHAEWSPDGSRLVMFGGPAYPQIFTTTTDGSHPRQLTERPGANVDPTYSPDGSTILFIGCPSAVCAPPNYELYTIPAGGGPATRLTFDHIRDNDPRFSPDGHSIAWESEIASPSPSAPAGIWQIREADANGKNVRVITSGNSISTNPFWSPDGSLIYFYRFVYGKPKWQLWSMKPDGSDMTQLTHDTSASSEMVSG